MGYCSCSTVVLITCVFEPLDCISTSQVKERRFVKGYVLKYFINRWDDPKAVKLFKMRAFLTKLIKIKIHLMHYVEVIFTSAAENNTINCWKPDIWDKFLAPAISVRFISYINPYVSWFNGVLFLLHIEVTVFKLWFKSFFSRKCVVLHCINFYRSLWKWKNTVSVKTEKEIDIYYNLWK